jgi:hypothetical protein
VWEKNLLLGHRLVGDVVGRARDAYRVVEEAHEVKFKDPSSARQPSLCVLLTTVAGEGQSSE